MGLCSVNTVDLLYDGLMLGFRVNIVWAYAWFTLECCILCVLCLLWKYQLYQLMLGILWNGLMLSFLIGGFGNLRRFLG